ncbi:SGNH/GDSL hydrolase family protein [Mucilaginibacter sp. RS28]|uniref:SGNH/GDSL hydrolase family protein n=1 Tax=Mucilaginibacter straminoryzae TaxID=2932774 RepID=A0A9X1X5P0_9SPHI|nr:SGNH/GDSL hydrolase family protein [Mucilaginibacter straminoryzae]MCJ8209104.1 SGNH/GDSL hydrolase family protein [Mucilaginibacter straminoryzae]
MKNLKLYFYLLLLTAVFSACKPEIHTPAPQQGSADFSRYIAVGNSLTAGYADGGLYLEGQQNSYPSIIAKQMITAGGAQTFNQPLFSQSQANGSGYLKLTGFDSNGSPVTASVTTNLAITGVTNIPNFGNVTTYTKYTGDIDNYGVPGIKLLHIKVPQYGNLNGFFERLLPGAEGTHTTTYLDFISAKPFTFFSNWLGNNDALGYATSGGAGDVLTDKAVFNALYTELINTLTKTGAKGVCATIPDVTAIPYFNTVTPALILAGVQKANASVQAIYVNAKSNTDVTSTTYAARPATASDLITLTFPTSKIGQPVASAGNLPYGLTPLTPIENQYVLDANEVSIVKDYVTAYNNTIKTVAASKNIAVADMYTFLNDVKAHGLLVDGVSLNSAYISGGLFSLDGVHLTPRGYAVVANQFIKAINTQYNANIPQVSVGAYNGVKFP